MFDNAPDAASATERLARHDVLVLGQGLERADHGDHEATRRIIGGLRRGGTEVYGYVPLGASTGLDPAQIRARVAAWKAMGVHGIFFDEAGFDFGNTRQRQNAAFALAHDHGLRVFANAWDPADLFQRSRHPKHNPVGEATVLRRGDAYLYESFGLVRGEPEPAADRQRKMERLAPARRLGVRVYGVTTASEAGAFDPAAWARVVQQARCLGLDGLGWGEHRFAAADNRMPPRPFPEPR